MNEIAAFYSGHVVFFAASVSVLGLLTGSFLNVVIYRLPIILEREWQAQAAEISTPPSTANVPIIAPRFSLSVPRSACPSCNARITAWQNIPVVSWLLLRGKCHACRAHISARYPLVELATAVLSGWVAYHFGFTLVTAGALIVTWSLIALAGIDFDHQLLPDNITLPLMWLGMLAAVIAGPQLGSALPVSPRDAVLGAAAGYVSLWLVFQAFRLVTGKEGMGYGDFKLFAALGAWLGWKLLPVVLLLSAATGAGLGIAMIAFRGRDRAAPMPFGPYLAAAGWLAMMYGEGLVNGYLHLSGLRR